MEKIQHGDCSGTGKVDGPCPTKERCPRCHQYPGYESDGQTACTTCHGTVEVTCKFCNGSGTIKITCWPCNGTGMITP